jgi:hypothetical protein
MSNSKFCTISAENALERFEKYPELKQLFPHLYQQMSMQIDHLNAAYAQTYLLDELAASEFENFKNNKIETERSVSYDRSFSGYLRSLRDKNSKIP